MKKLCIAAASVCLLAIVSLNAYSKGADSLYFRLTPEVSAGTSSAVRPLWSYSQNWGSHATSRTLESLGYMKTDWRFVNCNLAEFHLGAALEASTDKAASGVHELYLKGRFWKFDFSMGMDQYTPIDQQSDLGTGSYIMTDNARAIPKVAAGLYNWTSLPFIKDYIQVRGGLSFGYIPDSFYKYDPNASAYTTDVFTHEKFMYIRAGHWPVKPYVGLVHSALMGGTLADGTKIPVDLVSTFFARQSSSLGDAGFGGEASNAAGAHQGMWEFGTEIDLKDVNVGLYYRRPFADSRAMRPFKFAECKDYTLGMDLKLKDFAPVKEFCFEYMTTLWQGGAGLPDACFTTASGESVTLPWTMMTPENIHKYFSDAVIAEWESTHGTLSDTESCKAFLSHYTNNDEEFGGRSDYLCNYLYPQGWSIGSLSSGSPMFMTDAILSKAMSSANFSNRFPDVRMRTFCLGAMGNIMPQLDYRVKASLVSHRGSYREEYEYWSWTKNADDCFKEPLLEFNTGLWLTYHLDSIDILASAFCDFGQLYNSAALRLGVSYGF